MYNKDMQRFMIYMSNELGSIQTELMAPDREELDRVLNLNYPMYSIDKIDEL